jgi:hypothetical protein
MCVFIDFVGDFLVERVLPFLEHTDLVDDAALIGGERPLQRPFLMLESYSILPRKRCCAALDEGRSPPSALLQGHGRLDGICGNTPCTLQVGPDIASLPC